MKNYTISSPDAFPEWTNYSSIMNGLLVGLPTNRTSRNAIWLTLKQSVVCLK